MHHSAQEGKGRVNADKGDYRQNEWPLLASGQALRVAESSAAASELGAKPFHHSDIGLRRSRRRSLRANWRKIPSAAEESILLTPTAYFSSLAYAA